MSFNTIIEAEREADLVVNVAKEKARQLVSEALTKKEKAFEEANIQGEAKLRADLADFEQKLVREIQQNKVKSDKILADFEQGVLSNQNKAVEAVVVGFKN